MANGEIDVVVVGAGAAGLNAARELTRRGLSVTVLEAETHTGGRVHTQEGDGFYFEHGGIFHTDGYPELRRLIDEFGLAGEVRATPTAFHSAVRAEGAWHHADFGSLTGPLRTGILGWWDKLALLRSVAPALLSRPEHLGDLTSVAGLDTRYATHGLTARTASHFTAGPHEFLWGVPSERLSFAMFALQLQVFQGDLYEIRGGTSRVVERMAEGLDIRHATTVERVASTDDGVEVHVAGGGTVRARSAVLACPTDITIGIWPDAPGPVAEHLRGTLYSRIDWIYLRTRETLRMSADGVTVGMEVVPSAEVGDTVLGGIYGCDAWADEGGLLLITAACAAHPETLDDDTLAERLQADAEKLHPELVGQVTERILIREPHYTPIVSPGSVQRLAAARQHLPAGRIDLAGDHMGAPWMEGALLSGRLAAERTLGALAHT